MRDLRFSSTAQQDLVRILTRTHKEFGRDARLRYEHLISAALRDIAADPLRVGSLDRSDLGEGVRSFHLRHSRNRGRHETGIVRSPRHFILYRIENPSIVGIGRILHEAMEIERHLPVAYGDE
nr:type II toxin-antitoxin system RelE/ParE family toxin [Rhizobium sp. Q54]